MLRIFKQNTLGQIAAILIAVALLWTRAFLEPVSMDAVQHFSPIYDLLYNWLCSNQRLASAIALVLVIAEGVWLNIILINYKAAKANSMMPTFLYVVAMSWSSSALTITPVLLVNIMLIAACSQLLSDGATTLGLSRNFNSAFCVGLAALCYMPALSFVIPFLFVFVTYKLYRWRDIVVGILGLLAPSLVFFTYVYLQDRLQYDLILVAHDFVDLHVSIGSMPFWDLMPDMFFLLLLVAALFHTLANRNERVVHQRINSAVLTLPLLGAMATMLLTQFLPLDIQLMAIPFAFTTNIFLYADRKRKWIAELVFWLIIIFAIL